MNSLYDIEDLIESYDEVVANVRMFNFDLDFDSDLRRQLNQFRSWYYVPELDMFGPSKFVGYKNMTSMEYDRGYNKDGEATERALRKIFRPAQRSNPRRRALEEKLRGFCERYGKKPNKAYRINIPKYWV